MTGRPFKTQWREALAKTDIPVTTKALGWRMADYANKDGTSIKPGRERLADDLSVSVATIKRSLRILRDRGWIVVVNQPRYGDYGARPTEYKLQIPANQRVIHDPMVETGAASDVSGKQAAWTDQRVTDAPTNGSLVDDQWVMGDPLPIHDQSNDHCVSFGHTPVSPRGSGPSAAANSASTEPDAAPTADHTAWATTIRRRLNGARREPS